METTLDIRCNLTQLFEAFDDKESDVYSEEHAFDASMWRAHAKSAVAPAHTQSGVVVWYISTEDAKLSLTAWQFLLHTLPQEDITRILQFRHVQDQKLGILSRLLQRLHIRNQLRIRDSDYSILRTPQNKPYATSPSKHLGTWNYNVSHDGNFVAIASHRKQLIGVDIVHLQKRANYRGTAREYISIFTSQFTPGELMSMSRHATERDIYLHFFINWSLKEAYVKAVGSGLNMDLQRIHFMITIANDASRAGFYFGSAVVYVNGALRSDWRFNFRSIDETHIVTVACGPLQVTCQQFLPMVQDPSDVAAINLFAEFSEISISYLVAEQHLAEWNEILNSTAA